MSCVYIDKMHIKKNVTEVYLILLNNTILGVS